jgi:hypothetical protein
MQHGGADAAVAGELTVRWLVMVLSGLALVSCVPGTTASEKDALPGIKDRSSLRIVLVRTVCYGTCPMYGVEIRGDGTATYCGLHSVNEVGERTRQVADAELSALVEQFHEAKFFTLKDEYAADVTDNPTYSVSIYYDGKEKSVVDYVGERAGMPVAVTALQDAIDRISGTSEWIGEGLLGYATEWPACAARFGFEPPQPMPPAPL